MMKDGGLRFALRILHDWIVFARSRSGKEASRSYDSGIPTDGRPSLLTILVAYGVA